MFVIPGKSLEKPSASVANAANAPRERIPCGWYPKMYFRDAERGTERCKLAGKYDA